MHYSGLAVYEIDDTIALLWNILFRDHLDRLLSDYASHESGSIRNVGSWGSNAYMSSVGPNVRKGFDLQLSDGGLEGSLHWFRDLNASQQRLHFSE